MGKKRKTKEQKIISELRRKLSFTPPVTLPPARPQKIFPTTEFSPHLPSSSVAKNDYSYVFRDLKKVSLLIGLAILIQGVLYLALR